jgi:hypothetical protein
MIKKVSKAIFGILFFFVMSLFLCTANEKNLIIHTVSIVDGASIPSKVHVISADHNKTFPTQGTLETSVLEDKIKIKIESEKFEIVEFDYSTADKPNSVLTVALRPTSAFSGIVKNGATDQPVEGVTISLVHNGKNIDCKTESDGTYKVELPGGFYNLTAKFNSYDDFTQNYMITPGEELTEVIYILPKDKTKVSFSAYKSYNFEGRRTGHVAGYSQGLHAIIKKNADGTYRIWQDYGSETLKGTVTLFGNDDVAWMVENGIKTQLPNEAIYANKILIKANEEFMDLLNSLRSNPTSKITNLGVEAVNGVDCDKIRIVRDTKANWVGFYDCDITLWVMKGGKLAGMPTKMKGKISGRDEHHFYFDLDVDCSVTDVGSTFKIAEFEQK